MFEVRGPENDSMAVEEQRMENPDVMENLKVRSEEQSAYKRGSTRARVIESPLPSSS